MKAFASDYLDASKRLGIVRGPWVVCLSARHPRRNRRLPLSDGLHPIQAL